ncbi:hypothetical protein KJ840_05470 [Patescibacteria group bacterium]|nr:hypothetical protein [Patescibacteria group bacterium]
MALPLTLEQAIKGLAKQMSKGISQDTLVLLRDGREAFLNSWPAGKRGFQPGRIKLFFPEGTFKKRGSKQCWVIVAQDRDKTEDYFIITYPGFMDDDPNADQIIDRTLVELAESIGITAHAIAA